MLQLLAGASSHGALLAGTPSTMACTRSALSPVMAFYPVSQTQPKTPLKTALKKRSGAHTVSVEVIPAADGIVASIDAGELMEGSGARRTTELTASERLSKVSAECVSQRTQTNRSRHARHARHVRACPSFVPLRAGCVAAATSPC